MNDVQTVLLEMYKDIAKVLDENGIRYYLNYGSAIGALRHDGFIPWDDDIDITVWDEDIPLIKKCLTEQLDQSKYYYHDSKADTHPHVVFRTENFEEDLKSQRAPFIDFFPLVKYPSKKVRAKLSWMTIWGIHVSITLLDKIKSVWLYRHLLWVPKVFDRLSRLMINEDSDIAVAYTTGFARELFPAEWYGKGIRHKFEDTEVPLPDEYDKLLTSIFGDYMTPPPEDKRRGAGGYPLSIYKDYLLEKKKK
ncbi:MAG: LicD family protein [archaeon]|nr:LicD family protein [archaeon]